jgi:hypothetical protein
MELKYDTVFPLPATISGIIVTSTKLANQLNFNVSIIKSNNYNKKIFIGYKILTNSGSSNYICIELSNNEYFDWIFSSLPIRDIVSSKKLLMIYYEKEYYSIISIKDVSDYEDYIQRHYNHIMGFIMV